MTNPGDFREALLALVALGGGAFSIEEDIRFRPWPRSKPKDAPRGELDA